MSKVNAIVLAASAALVVAGLGSMIITRIKTKKTKAEIFNDAVTAIKAEMAKHPDNKVVQTTGEAAIESLQAAV